MKLKKWAIAEDNEEKTVTQKKKLLPIYHGPNKDMGVEAINGLLGMEAQVA
jgi:hypothetical protein